MWRRLTHSAARAPLQLAYEHFAAGGPPRIAHASSVVVCHGLFGSKQNWRSLARAMAHDWGVPIYTLDMRNHGDSPHSASMSYMDMAGDVARFLAEHSLRDTALIGHSLGGKVVMSVALDRALSADRVARMVSVDISPAEGPISREFIQYTQRMIEIDDARVSSRKEADDMLSTIEPDPAVRMFLLTNLVRSGDALRFRNPLRAMLPELEGIGSFPFKPGTAEWDGPTLLIKGQRSKFINRHSAETARRFFPHMQLVEMPTAHWCQAERPHEFKEIVRAFLA